MRVTIENPDDSDGFSVYHVNLMIDCRIRDLEKLKKILKNYPDVPLEVDDIDLQFFLTLYDHVGDNKEYLQARIIADWCNEMLADVKFPASWVGRKLTKYKFQKKVLNTGKYYCLSKTLIKNVLDRYFPGHLSDDRGRAR